MWKKKKRVNFYNFLQRYINIYTWLFIEIGMPRYNRKTFRVYLQILCTCTMGGGKEWRACVRVSRMAAAQVTRLRNASGSLRPRREPCPPTSFVACLPSAAVAGSARSHSRTPLARRSGPRGTRLAAWRLILDRARLSRSWLDALLRSRERIRVVGHRSRRVDARFGIKNNTVRDIQIISS